MIHIYSLKSHLDGYIVSLANYAECYDRMNFSTLKNASFLLTFIIVY